MRKALLGAALAVVGSLSVAPGQVQAASFAQADSGSFVRTDGYYYDGDYDDVCRHCGDRPRYEGGSRYWDDGYRDDWRERQRRWREWEWQRAWWWRNRGRREFCWRHPYHWRCYGDYY